MRSVLMFFLLMFSGPALATDYCYFDLNISQDRHFSDYRSADRWCTTVRGVFDDFQVCSFNRTDNYENPFHARMSFSRRFGGSGQTFSQIMNSYSRWTHGTSWRGNDYKHVLQYRGNCLSSSNGGYRGGY